MSGLTKHQSALAVGVGGVHLTSLEDAYRFASAVVQSGMAPKGYDAPEKVLIAIQWGAEIGLRPMQALSSIAVIQGRPTVWGDAIPALVRQSGQCEYIKEWFEGEGDNETAHCEVKRRDESEPCRRSFSVRDAKAAGLLGKAGPWQQYRRRMMGLRARSWACRDTFADVLRGLQIREEVQDYSAGPMPVVAVESKPVRRLSDLGSPEPVDAEPVADVTPEPSGVFAGLLAAAKRIDDGNSQEADELRAEMVAEWEQGNITADEYDRLRAVLAGAVPFG
jgi:hypothetical protein